MEAEARKRNQELWMSDEVRVLVGTIAFGLGINKADVRAVIHLSLPKSIEQFYQEAGRAGRDGQPADCILLWQPRDAGLLAYFIGQISDPAEKGRAWQRYNAVRAFAESSRCRHHQICTHFGETPKWTSCGACDVCGCESTWLTRPMEVHAARTVPAEPAQQLSVAVSGAGPDPELREYLREWRRTKAREQGVPAFIVMYDTSLEELCCRRPTTLAELRAISGFGERKTETYGREILQALERFRQGARATPAAQKIAKPAEETLRLLTEGRNFAEIAAIRGRQIGTVISTVADLVEKGAIEFQPSWLDKERLPMIKAACERLGTQWLKPLKEALPPEVTYEEIRLVVAHRRRQEQQKTA
jgi:ATP-dependent DNA helicase RecQ